jgi:DNA-binding IclR family transcriptional regulator
MIRTPVKSAARTLEVLELFHEERRPLRLSYIFQKLSYPQSSTTGLLKSMSMMGYLKYDRPTRTYFPTPRVAALGDWVNHFVYGRGDLLEAVQYVFEHTNETVAVSSQNDIFIQHIRVVQPDHGHKIPIPEGSMRVLTHSAPGLALMSRMDAKTIDRVCRQINAYVDERHHRADIGQVMEHISEIRKTGYSVLAAFPFPQASSVAVLLPQTAHGGSLTLGVGGLNERIMRNRGAILDVLNEAVRRYEERLKARMESEIEAERDAGKGPLAA